ncbi:MAG: thiol-disulfide isomerase [Acidobacteriota bacterium]|nr:thiol-disulfide isomerase [Acidobacteriota bacterium]
MRLLIILAIATAYTTNSRAASVSFYKDVLPILERRCQSCHRPGEIGPMPLLTYTEVRPWAAAIREAVLLRKMPPWFANPRYGKFANDTSLRPEEIETVNRWVAAGAPAGLSRDAPPPLQWNGLWNIARPDLVLAAPEPFVVKARATVDYQYVILSPNLTADRWAEAVEIRPSDRSVVHHAVLYVRERGDAWVGAGQTKSDILAIYTPGGAPATWGPGMAKLIPAGSDLVLQVHYTSKATTARNRMTVGIRFLRGAPARRVLTLQMGNDHLEIPPGERDYRVRVSGTLPRDALLVGLFPHMHLRGGEFEYQIAGSNGRVETLLDVKPYDFYWQTTYKLAEPKLLPAGTRLIWTAHYDNSPNNPRNPDPSAEVTWGEQSWEEMMIGFFDVAVDPNIDKRKFFIR